MNPTFDARTRAPRAPADDEAGRRPTPADAPGEAEGVGRPYLAEACRRLDMMSEVRECLAGESPTLAGEVAAFCEAAEEALAAAQGEDEAEDASAWVLRESEARWGEYLRLFEPGGGPDGFPDVERGYDDAPAAIDPGTLFRMLTGDDPPPGPAAAGSRHESPADPEPDPEPGVTRGDWSSLLGLTPGETEAAPGPTPSPADEPLMGVPAPPAALTIDPEFRETFLTEATDLFDRIETLVLGLGRGQRQTEILHELGRCFHTLKGAAGSVGLGQLAALVHGIEEHMEAADGEASDPLVALLHKFLHYLEGVFIAVRRGGQPFPGPDPVRAETGPAGGALEDPPAAEVPAADDAPGEGPVRVPAGRIDELMDLVSELITRRGLWAAQADTMKEYASMARVCRSRMMATIDRLRDLRPSGGAASADAGHGRPDPRRAEMPELIRRLGEQSDDLVVLTETAQAAAKPLSDNSDALARLTLQLWESLQAIRIVPVRGLFQRLARVAHDAARVEGRHVEVVMVGEETGLDRAVQDKAFEPLLHVVRNAVGHGIEPPEERRRAGKPEAGRVTLRAARAGNTLVLSVADDGRGLDYAAIAAKGRRLGLLSSAGEPDLGRLNALIFQPGFSTRDEANSISGRGVGMDVVSQEVGRMHGSVVLASETGRGTTLSVSLPARLALQQSMVLRVGGQAFAVPVELVELAQPFDPAEADRGGPSPRVRVRDRSVPLVLAREALGLSASPPVSCPKLLLIRADGGPLAVVVDAIDGTRELVVKPLGPLLSGHPVATGTSLSVTGEVIFALNPSGLARWPHPEGDLGRPGPQSAPRKADPVLVVDDSISVRKVVARRLRALGYEVEEVSDGLEALGKLRTHTYGLVLSDLEMPRMDGYELLAEMSRLSIAPTVPVVVASTRSDPETRRKVLAAGAQEFIAKPIEPDVLAAKVQELLRARVGPSAGAAYRGRPVAAPTPADSTWESP